MSDKADRRAPTPEQWDAAHFPGRPRHFGVRDADHARAACGNYGMTTDDPERVNCKLCFKTRRWRRS